MSRILPLSCLIPPLRGTLAKGLFVKSLEGKSILVTRPQAQAKSLVEALAEQGGRSVAIPTIEIVDPSSWIPVDTAIARLGDYDAILFTSANAAARFAGRLDGKSLADATVYAVGPATAAELDAHGVPVKAMARDRRAEGLLELLGDVRGLRFLFPRAAEGREGLPESIRAAGGRLDVVAVYETVTCQRSRVELIRLLHTDPPDCVTFLSGSAVKGFVELVGAGNARHTLDRAVVAVVGPVTEDALSQLGFSSDIQAPTATASVLAAAIARYFASGPG